MNKASIKAELRQAIPALSIRGLYHSTKFAAELVTQIDTEEGDVRVVVNETQPEVVEDAVMLAKTYFDLREYQRAAHALRDRKSPLAIFLRGYSTFLAGERRKEEETQEKADHLARGQVVNRKLKDLQAELEPLYAASQLDGFCLFLYGIVLKELDQKEKALQVLASSTVEYPCNWSAWKALAGLVENSDMQDNLKISMHWMSFFFRADVSGELQRHDHQDGYLRELETHFPRSTYILAQRATFYYQLLEFEKAQQKFEELRVVDEFRLENMDSYSDILFVKECKGALSYLAHQAVTNDKYSVQTCCIVGNYYSLKAKHEKAATYFQRALKLNPRYLSAWTLLGHEYVEMRNTSAAIEAYGRAVDINPRDYRAWYGLGQTYEMLQMYTYSLYYFRKGTTLRPFDSRMWIAMAETYERLSRIEDAIKCYLRAEGNKDPEGSALSKLAKLYNKLGDRKEAAKYYGLVLSRREERRGQDTVDALLYLTEYHKSERNYAKAEEACNMLLDMGGPSKEQAKSQLIVIHQLISRANPSSTSS